VRLVVDASHARCNVLASDCSTSTSATPLRWSLTPMPDEAYERAEAVYHADHLDQGGWDRRRQQIARRIERAELKLFRAAGYRNVTVADVATAARVSAGTVAR
jgi:hypothetical protein